MSRARQKALPVFRKSAASFSVNRQGFSGKPLCLFAERPEGERLAAGHSFDRVGNFSYLCARLSFYYTT